MYRAYLVWSPLITQFSVFTTRLVWRVEGGGWLYMGCKGNNGPAWAPNPKNAVARVTVWPLCFPLPSVSLLQHSSQLSRRSVKLTNSHAKPLAPSQECCGGVSKQQAPCRRWSHLRSARCTPLCCSICVCLWPPLCPDGALSGPCRTEPTHKGRTSIGTMWWTASSPLSRVIRKSIPLRYAPRCRILYVFLCVSCVLRCLWPMVLGHLVSVLTAASCQYRCKVYGVRMG